MKYILAVCLCVHLSATSVFADSIWLSWKDDNGANMQKCGFNVFRRLQTGTTWTKIGVTNPDTDGHQTYIDSGLDPTIQYCYQVTTFNIVGDSLPSNTACGAASHPDIPAPIVASSPPSERIAPCYGVQTVDVITNMFTNFETATTVTPRGYGKDMGLSLAASTTKKDQGWDRDLRTMLRQRNVNADTLLDTLILVPNNGPPATWTSPVKNGNYRITVSAGDPTLPQSNKITVEGVTVIDASTEPNQFIKDERIFAITDGNVTITVGRGTGNLFSTLNYVNIIPLQ